MNLELLASEAIERWQRAGGPLELGLRLASSLYGVGVQLRNRAFDLGLLPRRRAPMPVVSVGNLAAGGTGKTAIVRHLAELMRPGRVGIVTRGYGHSLPRTPYRVQRHDGAALVGDEPALLAKWLEGVPIVVSGSRYAGVQLLRGEIDVLLLDDGFQHRWLERDLDIVVLSPGGPEPLLPRGRWREPPAALKRADLLWIHEDGLQRTGDLDAWLDRWSETPRVYSRYRPLSIEPLRGPIDRGIDLTDLEGRRFHVFTTIARGERVSALLAGLGAQVTGATHLRDHAPITAGILQEVGRRARRGQADFVVMTEKDAIKAQILHELSEGPAILILKVQLEILDDTPLRYKLNNIETHCKVIEGEPS